MGRTYGPASLNTVGLRISWAGLDAHPTTLLVPIPTPDGGQLLCWGLTGHSREVPAGDGALLLTPSPPQAEESRRGKEGGKRREGEQENENKPFVFF